MVNLELGLRNLVDNVGGRAIRINAPFGENPSLEKIKEAFEINRNVKALYAIYNETSTGTTLRYMSELGKICEDNDTFFVADAVSILGGDDIPVDKWKVDICITASQKAFATPPGLAPMSISKEAKKLHDRKSPCYSVPKLKAILQVF